MEHKYFEWLYEFVCGDRFSEKTSFRDLMMFLHNTEFRYSIPMDENRANDGVDLRRRFAYLNDIDDYDYELLDCQGCSVLEMMIGLALRCEETIMDDPAKGDRTGQWFWGMINNLGLGGMIDSRFDEEYVDEVVQRFLDRDYSPDGRGGLFRLRHCDYDMRDVQIWTQLMWYLDEKIG